MRILVFPFIFILCAGSFSKVLAHEEAAFDKIGVEQKLNQQLPLSAQFYDEQGKTVRLKDYFTDKPVLWTFVYYGCTMVCPINLRYLAESLKGVDAKPGADFEVLVISFDPKDTPQEALAQKKEFISLLGKPQAAGGVHFLTGAGSSIQEITRGAGLRFVKTDGNGQFGHPVLTMIATPEGRISRYFFELGVSPRDIKLALMDAGQKKIGSISKAILHYCFYFDPKNGRYSLAILNILKAGAVLTVIIIGGLIFILHKQEKESKG